ncbi:MAG: metalloprotease [Rhizobiales bacterium]|nr:metalloprotease [Hyphomicrobiales bacterium]
MRWDEFRRSDNVEDARAGGGGFRLPGGRGGLGIGTVVVLGLIGWALGIDPRLLIGGAEMLSGGSQSVEQRQAPTKAGTPSDQMGEFVAAVLGSTEDRWKEIFAAANQRYRAPKLRLFAGSTQSACGFAQAAMGPFYCPPDERIYLDTSFFRALASNFRGCSGKACDFSAAYVITHEVGHHVQNLLGILPKVQQIQRALSSKVEANRLQVRVELQADCFAGVWAFHAREKHNFLEPGDVDAALQTASAIGDDMLQKRSQGYVVPDAFTHGSSEQRKRWFMTGFSQGKVSACDTFNAANL